MPENKKQSYAKLKINNDTPLTEQLTAVDAQYVRLEIEATSRVDKMALCANQYIWVDRTIKAKISLGMIEGLEKLIRMDVRELDGITEEVYDVAQSAFTSDRRFFLTLDCQQELGRQVLLDYIKQYENVEKVVLGSLYKEKLVGVLIAIKVSDTEYETVLGAILPEWQSKGAGVSLYAYEFQQLRKRDVKTLYSRISTENVASLNLHISLSKGKISFMQPLDVYIKG